MATKKQDEIPAVAAPVFTQEQFELMISRVMEAANRNTIEAVKEMKKLPDWEQEKQDQDRARQKEQRITRMRESIDMERIRKESEFNCELSGHRKHNLRVGNPSHAFTGQTNSDGFYRPVCGRCAKSFPKIKATDEQMRGGLGLPNLAMLTTEILYEWHFKTVPDCKDCRDGGCARKMMRELKARKLDAKPTVLPDGKVLAEQAAIA